jgi:hypothetical protein
MDWNKRTCIDILFKHPIAEDVVMPKEYKNRTPDHRSTSLSASLANTSTISKSNLPGKRPTESDDAPLAKQKKVELFPNSIDNAIEGKRIGMETACYIHTHTDIQEANEPT